jgi:hypothetical protein
MEMRAEGSGREARTYAAGGEVTVKAAADGEGTGTATVGGMEAAAAPNHNAQEKDVRNVT